MELLDVIWEQPTLLLILEVFGAFWVAFKLLGGKGGQPGAAGQPGALQAPQPVLTADQMAVYKYVKTVLDDVNAKPQPQAGPRPQ